MAATTFLTGQEQTRVPEPPLVAGPRLSLADGLRLLRTPSSEAGVQAYHRALEGAAANANTLLEELADLRNGRATRFELLALIATSTKARAQGVTGPGLLLLRGVRKAFIATGAAARIRARRALTSQAQDAALAASGPGTAPGDVLRRLVLLEGALLRLENRVFAQARENQTAKPELRVAQLERQVVDNGCEKGREALTQS